MISSNPYYTQAAHSIDSPALLVFPDLVHQNIRNAHELIKGENTILRPHVKTVKCLEVIEMALQHGIDRFKSSTISESELLAMAGVHDVLLCYQLSEVKALRFDALRKIYPNTIFSSLIDTIDSARLLSELFQEHPMDVFVDINLGMDRTGIKPEQTLDLVRACSDLKGLDIVGLHGYDGHVHSPDQETREAEANRIFEQMILLRQEVETYLEKKINVVLGGSPSFAYYAKKDEIECSPGTIFFWDAGYKYNYPELPFVPAAVLLTRIISIIDKNLLCFDLGSKAVAADPPQPRVEILDLENQRIVGQYEEHLVVAVPDTSEYRVGQPFFAVPYHICPTVNLYETFEVIREGNLVETWAVPARNRKITV
ncbi:alanine racemase [Ulvibacterium marinum]|uniref:D-TA family PLP-dependent enzyme n=1 Tax=Ulvibacterium marinum TaxID=2419782 RepID=A0A3B0C909_9FLAO|nr:alanine racemase [Ulvibacterium marinum]RKN80854.1 D-TA family PLP-dependent enzyme [Ulvibacterium marinum]